MSIYHCLVLVLFTGIQFGYANSFFTPKPMPAKDLPPVVEQMRNDPMIRKRPDLALLTSYIETPAIPTLAQLEESEKPLLVFLTLQPPADETMEASCFLSPGAMIIGINGKGIEQNSTLSDQDVLDILTSDGSRKSTIYNRESLKGLLYVCMLNPDIWYTRHGQHNGKWDDDVLAGVTLLHTDPYQSALAWQKAEAAGYPVDDPLMWRARLCLSVYGQCDYPGIDAYQKSTAYAVTPSPITHSELAWVATAQSDLAGLQQLGDVPWPYNEKEKPVPLIAPLDQRCCNLQRTDLNQAIDIKQMVEQNMTRIDYAYEVLGAIHNHTPIYLENSVDFYKLFRLSLPSSHDVLHLSMTFLLQREADGRPEYLPCVELMLQDAQSTEEEMRIVDRFKADCKRYKKNTELYAKREKENRVSA